VRQAPSFTQLDKLHVALAGCVAESIFVAWPERWETFLSPDDKASVEKTIDYYDKSFLEPYVDEIRNELINYWPAVQALAKGLLEKSYLSGGECKHIVTHTPRRIQEINS
jgi:hypothetical protein